MVSPLAKSTLGKLVGAGLQHNATKLSEQSGEQIIESLDEKIAYINANQDMQKPQDFSLGQLEAAA